MFSAMPNAKPVKPNTEILVARFCVKRNLRPLKIIDAKIIFEVSSMSGTKRTEKMKFELEINKDKSFSIEKTKSGSGTKLIKKTTTYLNESDFFTFIFKKNFIP